MLTHAKLAAVEMLNKHLGLYEKDNKQKADPLTALLNRIATDSGNGFKPVKVDPERDDDVPTPGGGSFEPRQDPGDDDGDPD